MTQGNQSTPVPPRHPLFGDLSRNRGWLLALGILSVILGIIGLGMTLLLTLVSVLYFGVLMIVVGGVQLLQTFRCTGWKSIIFHVFIGLLYVVAGIMIVTRPLLASVALTWTLAVILIAVGVLRLVVGVARNHPEAEVVNIMGWAGFLAIVPRIRAFKRTEIIDIRRFLRQEHTHVRARDAPSHRGSIEARRDGGRDHGGAEALRRSGRASV